MFIEIGKLGHEQDMTEESDSKDTKTKILCERKSRHQS